mmetsp:Transcript_136485/g.323237  ORF Transcript_136485/g.323237 Transcript_136485/m.323237 type:complete len:206 (-) Transcript_136485:67-684(-)
MAWHVHGHCGCLCKLEGSCCSLALQAVAARPVNTKNYPTNYDHQGSTDRRQNNRPVHALLSIGCCWLRSWSLDTAHVVQSEGWRRIPIRVAKLAHWNLVDRHGRGSSGARRCCHNDPSRLKGHRSLSLQGCWNSILQLFCHLWCLACTNAVGSAEVLPALAIKAAGPVVGLAPCDVHIAWLALRSHRLHRVPLQLATAQCASFGN